MALRGAGLAYVCSLVPPLLFAMASEDPQAPNLFVQFSLVELAFTIGFFAFIRARRSTETLREFYATCALTGFAISVILIPYYYAIVGSFGI